MIFFLRNHISTVLKYAELLFFPSSCKICFGPLGDNKDRVVCRSCFESLRFHSSSFCLSCGHFFHDSAAPHLCAHCLVKKPGYSLHRSCAHYTGKLKDYILLFKYRGYRVLGKDLAQFMLQTLGTSEEIWWGVDALVPVPLHPKRKRHRGFNQALVLTKILAREKNKTLIKNCLIKAENRLPQTVVEAQERGKNIRGAFAVKNAESIKDKVILLIDDVYTTGATVTECCETLLRAGAKEVRVITLAQA
ncbi:MAG: ComF family protein [Candidatus Aminicenantes bacterium]|nr:ComF family protein [Candidatus Aminicenantes bacterium]